MLATASGADFGSVYMGRGATEIRGVTRCVCVHGRAVIKVDEFTVYCSGKTHDESMCATLKPGFMVSLTENAHPGENIKSVTVMV